ncbi:MAG: archaeosortase/exosortase family protein [Cyanobacteria bacterium SZAS LIN-2]|nr:archaeosortase/exosortase family protein [Cyanobacteria bacterium SZAS LIN-3]MBS1994915.1 archaeosortase/exosortase family protein [Cyanobacteria bacterium SZAS LIN-2]
MIYALVLAVWPVWTWYVQRLTDRSDEPLGIVALITLVVMLRLHPQRLDRSFFARTPAVMAALALYFLSLFFAPKLVSALLALAAIGLAIGGDGREGGGRNLTMGDWWLLFLSLPLVASLNFYLGYPLRLAVTAMALPLLSITGFASSALGTSISWHGQIVEIDAPCSGIRMLWASLYLAATLASLRCLNFKNGFALMALAVVASVFANVLRVTSLFYLETGIVTVPQRYSGAVHEGVGVAVFFMLAICLLYLAKLLERRQGPRDEMVNPPADEVEQAGRQKKELSRIFYAACAVCALTSVVLERQSSSSHLDAAVGNVSWPTSFDSAPLLTIPLTPATAEFAKNFPGEIRVYTAGRRTVVLRHIEQATRQLHPAADCYKASGYEIKYLPLFTDREGNRWETLEAVKGTERLQVRERIYDGKGRGWTDVSAWYWAAMMGETRGPWWSVAVTSTID